MDQVAPHDSLLMDVLMGDTVDVIVFMMTTVSTTTLEASKPYYSPTRAPPTAGSDTPRLFVI